VVDVTLDDRFVDLVEEGFDLACASIVATVASRASM
jgi:hypothetical protein